MLCYSYFAFLLSSVLHRWGRGEYEGLHLKWGDLAEANITDGVLETHRFVIQMLNTPETSHWENKVFLINKPKQWLNKITAMLVKHKHTTVRYQQEREHFVQGS